LTSVTTIGGLAPLVLERSVQAEYLVPMAVTLSFGLMFTTVIALILVPTVYLMYSWVMPVSRKDEEEIEESWKKEHPPAEKEESYVDTIPKVPEGTLPEPFLMESPQD